MVRKIGSEVTKFKVGDRVAGISDNMFTTLAVAPEDRFVAIPDDLGFDEASTMLSPLITAMYCLIDVGNLRKHQVGSPIKPILD